MMTASNAGEFLTQDTRRSVAIVLTTLRNDGTFATHHNELLSSAREPDLIVTVMLREGVSPPADAPWLSPGELYTAVVILVDDREAFVRIIGPAGARCLMSTKDVRRIADDWPEH